MTTVGATAPAPLEELLRTRVARFVERVPDWDAFADARVEGYRRAQHRYIGAGQRVVHRPGAVRSSR